MFERLWGFPIRLTLATLYPRSKIHRALITNPGAAICLDEERIYSRNLEVPSGGGVGTAHATHYHFDLGIHGKSSNYRICE